MQMTDRGCRCRSKPSFESPEGGRGVHGLLPGGLGCLPGGRTNHLDQKDHTRPAQLLRLLVAAGSRLQCHKQQAGRSAKHV